MQTQPMTPALRIGHDRLAQAAAIACSYHVAQVRKGTEIPYVSHLLQVAGLVLEYGGTLEQAAAGMLHDVLEDTDISPSIFAAYCETRLTPRVAELVRECTDTTEGEGPSTKAPWAARKARHIEHLKTCSLEAAVVIACDKLHNIRTQIADLRHNGETVKFNASFADRRDVQATAIAALRDKVSARLFADLCDAHEEWETLHANTTQPQIQEPT